MGENTGLYLTAMVGVVAVVAVVLLTMSANSGKQAGFSLGDVAITEDLSGQARMALQRPFAASERVQAAASRRQTSTQVMLTPNYIEDIMMVASAASSDQAAVSPAFLGQIQDFADSLQDSLTPEQNCDYACKLAGCAGGSGSGSSCTCSGCGSGLTTPDGSVSQSAFAAYQQNFDPARFGPVQQDFPQIDGIRR